MKYCLNCLNDPDKPVIIPNWEDAEHCRACGTSSFLSEDERALRGAEIALRCPGQMPHGLRFSKSPDEHDIFMLKKKLSELRHMPPAWTTIHRNGTTTLSYHVDDDDDRLCSVTDSVNCQAFHVVARYGPHNLIAETYVMTDPGEVALLVDKLLRTMSAT